MVSNYIKHDDGKITINTWVAALTFILLIVTSLVSIIALTTTVQNKVDQNQKDIGDLKEQNKIFDNEQKDVNSRVTVVETNFNYIKSQLDRIENKLEVS